MASTINATPTSSGLIQTADSTGVLALQTGGTTAVTISATQNVGIGTTNTGLGKLTAQGTITAKASADESILSLSHNGSEAIISASYGSTGSYDPMVFKTSDAERMRIDSSGQVLFGTTVTDPTFSRSNGVNISAGSILSRSAGGWDCGISGSSGNNINFYTDNGSSRVSAGFISSNGGTSTYATSSDYRMKEDVQPISNALNSVMQLKPVNYKWKPEFAGTKINGQGFIAHELQAVVPDCVTGEKDAVDAYGNPKYQGIDTSFLVATLTAAIQEQQAIITEQANAITALEARLTALEIK
jgi:hypothetical protein